MKIPVLLLVTTVTAVAAQDQQLVLRSSATSVAVHVLVQSGSKPVRDLRLQDFVLTDSGVRQTIETMTVEPLPLDVTIVLDRLEQSEFASRESHPQLEDIEGALAKDDHLRIIAVGTDIEETQPLGPPGRLAFTPARKSDQPALFDGVASALLRSTLPGRQHVVIAITEGYDAYSFTSAAVLTDIGQRSGAQLYLVVAEGRRLKTRTLARAPNPLPLDDGLGSLSELAQGTGGNVVAVGRMTRSIGASIRRVFDDVRSGFVLYYTPTGVAERGWHPIEVTVARPGTYDVRARRGYAN